MKLPQVKYEIYNHRSESNIALYLTLENKISNKLTTLKSTTLVDISKEYKESNFCQFAAFDHNKVDQPKELTDYKSQWGALG